MPLKSLLSTIDPQSASCLHLLAAFATETASIFQAAPVLTSNSTTMLALAAGLLLALSSANAFTLSLGSGNSSSCSGTLRLHPIFTPSMILADL